MSKDSCRDGKWKKGSVFRFLQLDETGALNYFTLSQTKTDIPTRTFLSFSNQQTMMEGIVHRIHYRLNPTNVATFTLRIWAAARDDDYASNAYMLYETPALQVDDTDYDITELMIPFVLGIPGYLYYSVEWSAAPGVTSGFVEVTGEKIN